MINKIIHSWLPTVGAIAGLIGINFLGFMDDNKNKAIISLAITILFLLYIAALLYLLFRKRLAERYPKGYATLSTQSEWSTTDGCIYSHTLIRHIQVKQIFMHSFSHCFQWSGSKEPNISSPIQSIKKVEDLKNGDGSASTQYILGFPDLKLYNDCEIIYLEQEIDDSDNAAATFLGLRVEDPVRLITFKVELTHASQSYRDVAKVTRHSIEFPKLEAEDITTVTFNTHTKTYTYIHANPEPGYYYKIEWKRPAVRKRGRGK